MACWDCQRCLHSCDSLPPQCTRAGIAEPERKRLIQQSEQTTREMCQPNIESWPRTIARIQSWMNRLFDLFGDRFLLMKQVNGWIFCLRRFAFHRRLIIATDVLRFVDKMSLSFLAVLIVLTLF